MGRGVYKMTSWDCFDTLVARRFGHPHTIFEEVGRRLKLDNFVKQRVKAEKRSNKTYKGIYENLPDVDPSIEFEIELDHLFGIQENINRIKDGDIIVSDMYLTEEHIKQILKSCGVTKDIQVYVTPGGKHNGDIWASLPPIDLHIGDNWKSDVESPTAHGIRAEHYTEHQLTNIEKTVSEHDINLAYWMRYVRLKCPYTGIKKQFWIDQANFNLPVLALASLELPDVPIAFSYRDSVYWQPLYEALTKKKSKRLDVSRHCYYNPSPEFAKYVTFETNNHVIVDLQGTGRSLNAFFKNSVDAIYICGPTESPVVSLAGQISDSIERHNCSSIGPLIGWDSNGPIRGKCEHDLEIVEVQASAMKIAIESAELFSIKRNKNLLIELLWKMKGNFTHKNIKWTKNNV